jgi:acetyltransferase-like isoleucine patch superfamily enzyme
MAENQAYRLGLKRVGHDVTVWPLAKIVAPEVVSIGDAVIIDDFAFLMGGKSTEIGSFVHVACFASITGGGELVMADFSGVSSGARVFTGNDDYGGSCLTGPTVPEPFRIPVRSYVHLGKHVVVGANSVILPGVVIGEGAVVGANSLVRESCEPWTVYAGTPARAIRPRPREKILELEVALRRQRFDAQGNYLPKGTIPSGE